MQNVAVTVMHMILCNLSICFPSNRIKHSWLMFVSRQYYQLCKNKKNEPITCNCKTSTSIGLTEGVARCLHFENLSVNDMQIITFFLSLKIMETVIKNNIFEG